MLKKQQFKRIRDPKTISRIESATETECLGTSHSRNRNNIHYHHGDTRQTNVKNKTHALFLSPTGQTMIQPQMNSTKLVLKKLKDFDKDNVVAGPQDILEARKLASKVLNSKLEDQIYKEAQTQLQVSVPEGTSRAKRSAFKEPRTKVPFAEEMWQDDESELIPPVENIDVYMDEQETEMKEWMKSKPWIQFYFEDKLSQIHLKNSL